MEWASKFDAARARAWLMRLACVALLFGIVGSAVGELPKDRPSSRRESGRSLGTATIANSVQLAVNRVIMLLQDNGEIGSSGSSVAGGGFWKAVTNQYIFSSGPNVGAKLPNGTIVVAIGGPFSELHEGSERFPELNVYWDSQDPNDRASFPEVCTVDASRIERFPSLASFAGEPFPGFADRTLCIAVNDYTGGTCADCAGTRVGVTIVETIFAFGVPTVQDFVFAMIRMYNDSRFINASNSPLNPPGPYTLSETMFAFAVDADIGDAGDDQIAFLPDAQTMAFWDRDFTESGFQGPLGVGGIGLVVLPIDPVTGNEIPLAEFTLFTNGAPRPDPQSKEEWYALMEGDPAQVLLVVDPRDVRGMVSTAKFALPADAFVEMGAAYFFADLPGAPPADLLGEAYKNLVTGEIIPNANDSEAFDLLRQQAAVAAASGNAGFLQPVAPPSPNFVQIPGDRQITIVWDAEPVGATNPFARIVRNPFDPASPVATGIILGPDDIVFHNGQFQTAAQAGLVGQEVTNVNFNANFTVFDFEGFRVYRSRTGLADDAELIAQFDLGNEFSGGEFCVAAVPVFASDGSFVQNVCTEIATQAGPFGGGAGDASRFGSNTGLLFSVVDRGGSFPDPSIGPGLINGIPVAHAVTSFSVQCGIVVPTIPIIDGEITETVPPAACLSLESGKVFKLATPESNPSSFVDAQFSFTPLKADGTNCDASEPAYTVDATTGHFTNLVDCSTAVVATLAANRATNIPTGDFFFVIDKIETPCIPGPAPACYNFRAVGSNTVFYHWEKAGGAPATEIVPQSGTFSQHFELAHASIARVGSGLDTNPNDVGNDLDIAFIVNWDNSVIEDLEVNGSSLHLEELGGDHGGGGGSQAEARPHGIVASSLADFVHIGMRRVGAITATREEHHPIAYSTGASSFELTWVVEGNNYSGVLRRLPGGQEVPHGGRPRGPDNPSTAGDFTAGYNWGFCAPNVNPVLVQPCTSPPNAGPLLDTIQLSLGQTFSIYVPSNQVWIQGIRTLPVNGDKWVFRIEGNFRRGAPDPNGGVNGREPQFPTAPFSFVDLNSGGEATTPRQFTNVFPGARWKLSLSGGSNELADADLTAINVVPNPFIGVNEITRGRGLQRILFTNMPPVATIRIFTINGNLVRVLEHTDGSGTEEFDVRTRYDLLLASGNYYYHVTTPDGRTHIGRFAVIN